jgi:hypothetical protein
MRSSTGEADVPVDPCCIWAQAVNNSNARIEIIINRTRFILILQFLPTAAFYGVIVFEHLSIFDVHFLINPLYETLPRFLFRSNRLLFRPAAGLNTETLHF